MLTTLPDAPGGIDSQPLCSLMKQKEKLSSASEPRAQHQSALRSRTGKCLRPNTISFPLMTLSCPFFTPDLVNASSSTTILSSFGSRVGLDGTLLRAPSSENSGSWHLFSSRANQRRCTSDPEILLL